MGRFVYQPVPAEMEASSKHGQVIVDIYSGHISTNHNNVIVSATKRIEDKIDDVYQIESNIVEQTNVINNLNDDYYLLLDTQYLAMIIEFNDVKIDSTIKLGTVNHLKRGIGDPENSEDLSILEELLGAINGMKSIYSSAIQFHNTLYNSASSLVSGRTIEYGGMNLSNYIDKIGSEISEQRTDIMVLKNNIIGKLG